MAGFNYKEEVLGFQRHLSIFHSDIMPLEEDPYEVCKKVSMIKFSKFRMTSFNYSKVKELFMNQISTLGENTRLFYDGIIPNVRLKRINYANGGAQICGFSSKQVIYVTNRDFKDIDFIATSHEFGHIPTFINPCKNGTEYYEFLEAFPIYLEYIACKSLYGECGMKKFIDIKLDILKEEAQGYFQQKKCIKGNDSYSDQYYKNGMIESYKYIKSFDYALQLIERSNDNQELVNQLLYDYVLGNSSLKDISKSLDIDTAGCKHLLSYSKK